MIFGEIGRLLLLGCGVGTYRQQQLLWYVSTSLQLQSGDLSLPFVFPEGCPWSPSCFTLGGGPGDVINRKVVSMGSEDSIPREMRKCHRYSAEPLAIFWEAR